MIPGQAFTPFVPRWENLLNPTYPIEPRSLDPPSASSWLVLPYDFQHSRSQSGNLAGAGPQRSTRPRAKPGSPDANRSRLSRCGKHSQEESGPHTKTN